MPKYLHNAFTTQIDLMLKKRRERIFPFLYLIITFISLMYVDVLYKYFNYGILFDPDIIHILFIDLTLALIVMVFIGMFPAFLRRHVIAFVITFFAGMAFLYTTLGFEGVIRTNVNDLEVMYELLNRMRVNYEHVYLIYFIPLIFGVIPIKIHYTLPRYIVLVFLLLIASVSGGWYLQSSLYNNPIEATTNYEKIIFNDEGELLFTRLGSNIGLIRNSIDYDGYNIDSKNAVSAAHEYIEPEKAYNDFTGKYAGKNLVIIEVDNLDYMALQEDVMPSLWALSKTGLEFINYFDERNLEQNFELFTGFQEGSKSLNSVLTYGENSFPNALGNQFRRSRYKTIYLESVKDTYYFESDFIKRVGFDNYYDSQSFNESNLNSYNLATESAVMYFDHDRLYSHYKFTDLLKQPRTYAPDADDLSHLDVDEKLLNYYSYANVVDKGINRVVESVAISGKLDKTVFIIASTGHVDYFEDDYIRENSFARQGLYINRVPFVIWDGSTDETISEPMAPVNIPATLANMFDFRGEPKYIAPDVFARGSNVVSFNNRSWISEAGFYNANTQKFTVVDEAYLTDYLDEYILLTNKTIYDRYLYSRIILENNYFALIFIWYVV